jgi:hypothetical protein
MAVQCRQATASGTGSEIAIVASAATISRAVAKSLFMDPYLVSSGATDHHGARSSRR